jgi:hypothetical protein
MYYAILVLLHTQLVVKKGRQPNVYILFSHMRYNMHMADLFRMNGMSGLSMALYSEPIPNKRRNFETRHLTPDHRYHKQASRHVGYNLKRETKQEAAMNIARFSSPDSPRCPTSCLRGLRSRSTRVPRFSDLFRGATDLSSWYRSRWMRTCSP